MSRRRRPMTVRSDLPAQQAIDLSTIDRLAGGRPGESDCACPACGPDRRSAVNRRRKVLRIWPDDPNFASFHCARCGLKGFARSGGDRAEIDPRRLAKLKAEAAARDEHHAKRQQQKAFAFWRMSLPARGSIVKTYLRARGITIEPPATIRFLLPIKKHWRPAMIAAFGMPDEPEPGMLEIADDAVCGVHLTLLKPDGSGKAGTDRDKFTIGRSTGMPIVLAPMTDALGLAITEGIEDALSVHQATGLGAWAAGSWNRMPPLAAAVPDYAEAVTIFAHNDPDGRKGAAQLATALISRAATARIEMPEREWTIYLQNLDTLCDGAEPTHE